MMMIPPGSMKRCSLLSAAVFIFAGMIMVEARGEGMEGEGVSRELARSRAANISDLRYRLSLALAPGAEKIPGRAEIRLRLARAEEVILDFRDLDTSGRVIDGKVGEVTVNGRPAAKLRQANGHLVLPAGLFAAGENMIALSFEAGIAPAGRPLTRHIDRDDGSEYVYTLFVPMDASLAYPCFDQPDLKGRFTLELTAPRAWTVVSNAAVARAEEAGEGRRRTLFRETLPISTYLFAFAAGPFEMIADEGAMTPTRLFVRRSKLGRAREEGPEIFRLTRGGMRHLSGFFDRPFPFPKYDLVLLSGFAYGGMEHAGASFFREEALLFRTLPTASDRLGRASLLLHELSHQWFGDLVTMRWFDDLWLKEGFADYMAYHAMAALQAPNEIWKRFYQTHKPRAYAIDATRGTTPIYQEVRNLRDAKSAYGAIVYAKAPALLRALSFVIGETAFRDGVRLFLKEHAFANAEWADLIRAFERVSRLKLESWAAAWVLQRGMPQIDVAWQCADGKIASFELRQRDALDEGGRWPVSAEVLLAFEDGKMELIPARIDGQRATLGEAIGRRCPAYVFANHGDYGYGRFMLDATSRAAIASRLGSVADPFLRAMLWGALWDAVREAVMDPREYLALALRLLPAERDEELTGSILSRATIVFERYLSDSQRGSFAPALEQLAFDRMLRDEDLGRRITWFRAFRQLATTNEARGRLKDVLRGKIAIPGVELKPLDRWAIVRALLASGDAEAEALLASERARDTSDDGRKQAYLAEAARGEAATKRRYSDDYLRNRAIPEDWVEGSLAPFNSWNQSELTRPYLRPALEALPQLKRERKIFFVLAWLEAFLSGRRDAGALAIARDFLRDETLDRDLRLKVLEASDELERTLRILEKFP
jgi:aminopeptidase N